MKSFLLIAILVVFSVTTVSAGPEQIIKQRAKDLRGLRCVRATMDATNVGCRTAARADAKIVSDETGLKKFFLNLFRV